MSWSFPFGWLPSKNPVHEMQQKAVNARDLPSYLAKGPGAYRLACFLAVPAIM